MLRITGRSGEGCLQSCVPVAGPAVVLGSDMLESSWFHKPFRRGAGGPHPGESKLFRSRVGRAGSCRPKLEAGRPSWKNVPMAWFPPHDPRPHAFRWIWGRGAIAWTSRPSWPEICGVGTFLSGCSLWKRKERKCPNPKPIIGSFKSPASVRVPS